MNRLIIWYSIRDREGEGDRQELLNNRPSTPFDEPTAEEEMASAPLLSKHGRGE